MIENKLDDNKKLEYFGLATRFHIAHEISIEHRGQPEDLNADKWAITDGGLCYDNKSNKWDWEDTPSARTEAFIARTRYPLNEAFDIVNSEKFKKYLK